MLSELFNASTEVIINGKPLKIRRLVWGDLGELVAFNRSQDYARLEKEAKEQNFLPAVVEVLKKRIFETRYYLDEYMHLLTDMETSYFAIWLALRKDQPEITFQDVKGCPWEEFMPVINTIDSFFRLLMGITEAPEKRMDVGTQVD